MRRYFAYKSYKSASLKTILSAIVASISIMVSANKFNPETSGSRCNIEISTSEIRFDQLFFKSTEDQFSVEVITRDNLGYLWIGAKEGLFRYDGTKIVEASGILPDLDQSLFILGMCAAADSSLWILTNERLYQLDPGKRQIIYKGPQLQNIALIGNLNRGSLFISRQGKIYCGYWGGGMIIFDPTNEKYEYYFNNPLLPVQSNTFTEFFQESDSTILLATHDGLFRHRLKSNSFQRVYSTRNPGMEALNRINCIHGSDNNIWLGTNAGLVKLDEQFRESRIILFPTQDNENYDNNIVESITEDENKNLWIGTRFGLHHFSRDKIISSYYANESLNSNYVRTVYYDQQQILWVGHRYGALSLLSPGIKKFTSYIVESGFPMAENVYSIYSENQIIWFGTGNGLFKHDRNLNQTGRFLPEQSGVSLAENNLVSGIIKHPTGEMFISTDKGGLYKMSENGVFKKIFAGSGIAASFSESDIWYMTIDSKGTIWCGTGGDGLISYQPASGIIKKYHYDAKRDNSLSSNFIGPILEGENGNLWVGTSNKGLNYFNPDEDKSIHFLYEGNSALSIRSNEIMSLELNNEGVLYIGTGEGLSMLDTRTMTILEVPDNEATLAVAQSVELDEKGNIWIGTREGLIRFNLESESYNRFLKSDGLPANSFMSGVSFNSSGGNLLFGSMNGLVEFHPSEIITNKRTPRVLISEVIVNDISSSQDSSINEMLNRRMMVLPYDQNNISFFFSCLDFIDSDKNRYAYMLGNHDKIWIKPANTTSASYQNLEPGTYQFKLAGSNNDNLWNWQGDIMTIIIKPPFWETMLFKVLLFIVIIAGVMALIQMRIRNIQNQKDALQKLVGERTAELSKQNQRVERKNLELEKQKKAIEQQAIQLSEINEKLEKQNRKIEKQKEELKEMDRLKSIFFTNISHEFRTPLTLILNALDHRSSFDADQTDEAKFRNSIIKSNSYRLLRLIEQLLDISKIEAGYMPLTVSEGDHYTFFYTIANAFKLQAASSGQDMQITIQQNQDPVLLDWDKLEKIVYNLLSNAIKNTPSGGNIKMDITFSGSSETGNEQKLIIQISDTGTGIPPELQKNLFTRFINSGQNGRGGGTGIGLSLTKQLVNKHKGTINFDSSKESGTKFLVEIPCSRISYSEEEMVAVLQPDLKYIEERIKESIREPHLPIQEAEAVVKEKVKIMFVDDNRELCDLVQRELGKQYHLFIASNGEEGFGIATEEIPDVIISDIRMPVADGIELLKNVRNDIRTDHIPFIILTSSQEAHTELEALNKGANDYIIKPFLIENLLLKIRNQMDIRNKTEKKLANEFLNSSTDKGSGFNNPFLTKVVTIIENNLEDPEFNATRLAEKLGMSRAQLYRKFSGLISISANNFIRELRLKKAHLYLLSGQYNVNEAAALTGFNSTGYFSGLYEKKYGTLPSKQKG